MNLKLQRLVDALAPQVVISTVALSIVAGFVGLKEAVVSCEPAGQAPNKPKLTLSASAPKPASAKKSGTPANVLPPITRVPKLLHNLDSNAVQWIWLESVRRADSRILQRRSSSRPLIKNPLL